MVEQCRNDPLVGILLDEVAGIRHPRHNGMGERSQPQLQVCRREGSVLHAPGDADGLVPEMTFEPVLQLAPEVRDGIARTGGNLLQEDQHAGTARCGRVRREVRPLDIGGQPVTVLEGGLAARGAAVRRQRTVTSQRSAGVQRLWRWPG